jgi:hypothetical protein
MRQEQQQLQVLSPEQATSFLEQGFVVVREAFHRDTAAQLLPHVWARVEEHPTDRSTWKRAGTQIESIIHDGPIADLFTPRFCGSLDDLLGSGRWWTRRDGIGWVVLRFPDSSTSWQVPATGWHVDGIHFHHHLTSPEQGLVGIEMLTDIEPGGGGTAVRVGSHKVVARLLHEAEPEGLPYARMRAIAESLQDLPAVEVTGRAGDVLWMHPFMVHARSPNTRDTVRIAANRCVGLHEPMRLQPEHAASASLVEKAILQALAERR